MLVQVHYGTKLATKMAEHIMTSCCALFLQLQGILVSSVAPGDEQSQCLDYSTSNSTGHIKLYACADKTLHRNTETSAQFLLVN